MPRFPHSPLPLVAVLLAIAPPVLAQQALLDRSLHRESWRGNVEEVARLLKQGANPNIATQGSMPLHKAAGDGHLEIMRLLIKGGADVNAQEQDGRSVLAEAVSSHDAAVVRFLLDAGAKPDGFALGQACWLGRAENVQLLLDAGAKPDDGLVRAAQGGHAKLVKLLLDKGADVNTTAQSKVGDTALHTGALQGGPEVVRLLLEHGANPNFMNKARQTPLHRAISGDCELETVKLLVAAGARLNMPDEDGMTPVRMAAVRGRNTRTIYDWLIQSAGGKEPIAQRPADEVRPLRDTSTKTLIAALTAVKYDERTAARRELVARGGQILPEALQCLEAGDSIAPLLDVLVTVGPEAEPALPKVESLLASQQHGFSAFLAIERLKPGSFERLPLATREKAADTLYEAIAAAEPSMLTGYSLIALISMGDVSTASILKLLDSGDPELRRRAASTVKSAEFASESITAKLVKLATTDENRLVRLDALGALGIYGAPSESVKQTLLSQLMHPPPRVPPGADEEARRQLSDWHDTADRAARSLARFGPGIIDELLPMLTPLENPQRRPAITALVCLGGLAVPRLIELLGDDDSAVAISASVALANIGSAAVPALAEALKSDRESTVIQAAGILSRLGKSAAPAMPTLLQISAEDRRSDLCRVTAARAVLAIDPTCRSREEVLTTIPALLRILEKGSFREQGLAAETAGKIGPAARQALPLLHACAEWSAPTVDTQGLVRDYVQRAAQEAIAAIEKGAVTAQP